MFGSGYAVECCIAAYNSRQEQRNWQIYMSDAAAALINMFAKGEKMPRYWDIIHPEKRDQRSGEEIAMDIIKRHGLTVVK